MIELCQPLMIPAMRAEEARIDRVVGMNVAEGDALLGKRCERPTSNQ